MPFIVDAQLPPALDNLLSALRRGETLIEVI
jgi:hypothetical protein